MFLKVSAQCVDDRGCIVHSVCQGTSPVKDNHHGDIQNRADHERGNDPDREIALGILVSSRPWRLNQNDVVKKMMEPPVEYPAAVRRERCQLAG